MHAAIVRDPIDPRIIEDTVRGPGYGGIVTFAGSVRDRDAHGRPIAALLYEAYEAMALEEMRAIGAEARERFGDVRVAMVHRIGEVRVGEIAVVVCACARHRRAAFDACAYAIDALKARAEIWKQERYPDGSARWLANQTCRSS